MNVRNPEKAFTLLEIMIVVALVGLLATIASPTWVRARTNAQAASCINNLKQVDGAVQQWALETKAGASAVPQFNQISGYLKSAVTCPADNQSTFATSYIILGVSEKPACRIGSGLPAPFTHVMPDTGN